jgi:hypothetical protein
VLDPVAKRAIFSAACKAAFILLPDGTAEAVPYKPSAVTTPPLQPQTHNL